MRLRSSKPLCWEWFLYAQWLWAWSSGIDVLSEKFWKTVTPLLSIFLSCRMLVYLPPQNRFLPTSWVQWRCIIIAHSNRFTLHDGQITRHVQITNKCWVKKKKKYVDCVTIWNVAWETSYSANKPMCLIVKPSDSSTELF